MGDNYYNQQPYSPGGAQRDPYAQSMYAQQSGYNSYQSPMEEGYRGSPTPQNLQVAPYDDRSRRSGDYSSRPRSRHGDRYDDDRYSDRGHYLPPPSPNSRRPSSRGSFREKEHDHRKNEAKSIGATILGGVAGALIGRKAGHKDILPTVLGGVAGAWGGHKLEEEFTERHGKNRERKLERSESLHDGRGRERRRSDESVESERKGFREKIKDRIRSLSRKRIDDRSRSRSVGRRRRDDSVDSYDSDRDRRRRSSRYESEGRSNFERDSHDYRDRDRDRDY